MGMYTWLSDSEFELYSKVSNKELNEVFQEVREVMPGIFISERTETNKRLFKKRTPERYRQNQWQTSH